jgi:hypothetical protein
MTRFGTKVPRGRCVGVVLLAAVVMVVAGVSVPAAALTTPSCRAKKLKQRGKLRKCQAVENAKAPQGKPADPGKCQTTGPPNGTVYTVILRTLSNATSTDGGATITGGFAGHCDWRLSSIGELRSIVLPMCGGSPCIDETAFGPTRGGLHWSDTVVTSNVPLGVNFLDGTVGACALFCSTTESFAARAARLAL